MRLFRLFFALLFSSVLPLFAAVDNSPLSPGNFTQPIRVACVGDSITAGFGIASASDYYPSQLGKMLGTSWAVSNFGGSGATLLKNGDNPYYRYPQFANALNSQPDVVVIMLGANDARAGNWTHSSEFKEDYRWLIQQFRALGSQPRIFICRPCFAVANNSFGILENDLQAEIPWINQLADEESIGLIDHHALTQANPSELGDGVHPNAKGAARLAENTFHALTGEDFPAQVTVRALAGKVSLSWFDSQVSTPFAVSRATVSGGLYAPLSSNNTAGSYDDANAPIGGTYFYSLATSNIYGVSATSPEIAVAMTAETGLLNRTTGGTASASAGNATAATDGLETTDWTTGGSGHTATVQYDQGNYTNWVITSYRVVSAAGNAASDPADWQFQGSTNGSVWTTLDTQAGQTFSARRLAQRYPISNNVPYRFYRLNVTATAGSTSGVALAEFQLWSEDSDGLPAAKVETSGQGAAQAFDGSSSSKWYTGSGNTSWIQYLYGGGAARRLESYTMTSANDVQDRDPKNWQFQGSNDGTTWTTIQTRSGEVFASRTQTNTYPLSATTPYRYHRLDITANFGAAGNNVGIQLAELSLVPAAAPPLAPAGLTLSAINGQVVLNWTPGAGATSYTVQRATAPGGPFTTVASGLGGTSFRDDSAPLGSAFYYLVLGSNSGGNSPSSSVAATTDLATVPAPPIGLSAGGVNFGVHLEWSASAGATSYCVKRSLWNGGPFQLAASEVSATSFTDSGLLNGTTYYYTVTATGPGGESAGSIQIRGTPKSSSGAAVGLPFLHPLFTNNAVLQRDALVPIWGWTTPGAQVSVSIHGQTQITNADPNGRWQVQVGPFSADGSACTLTVAGPQTATLTNLLFGDVFLFSGQSNMERQLKPRPPQPDILNYQAEAAAANFPNIRQFSAPEVALAQTQQTLNANWTVCIPASALNFCAVGFFMARELFQTTNVPIGIVHSAWGGTRIDPWLESAEAAIFPEFQTTVNTLPGQASPGPTAVSGLYGSMIAPLAPFRLKGVVWYQGETSADRPEQYSRLLPSLMRGWRRVFGVPNLPFIIIQLPNYSTAVAAPVQSGSWAEIREAQQKSVTADPYARLVTTIDIGNSDIHPPDKQDVGKRAALAALEIANGQSVVSQGPLFTGAVIQGAAIRCSFSHTGAGLMVGSKTPLNPAQQIAGGTLTGFAIAGADKNFVAANAVLSGSTVVVSSASVSAPLYVRYGWANMPACNLYNKITDAGGAVVDGLPASPFRNDPIARLAVTNGSGSNTYAPGAAVGITGNTVTGGTFRSWSGDTALLAAPTALSTTVSVNRSYVSVGANYQLVFPPAGVTATAGSLQVNLAWTALANATSYSVKRAPTSGGPYTTIASGLLAPVYADVAVSTGAPYFYVVSAHSSSGDESPASSEVTATPNPPSAPAGLTATAGDGVVSLTWSPLGSASGYTLSSGTASGGPFTPISTNQPGTIFVNTNRVNGTKYFYVVNGVFNGTPGPVSAAVSATPSANAALLLRSIGGSSLASTVTSGQTDAEAFDRSIASKWYTTVVPTVADPDWVQYQFGNGAAWAINRYTITSAGDVPERDPMNWQLLGSNDGATWTQVDQQSGKTFASRGLAQTYDFSNASIYRFYRLSVTATRGGSGFGVQLAELALFSSPADAGDKTPPVFGTAPHLTVPASSASGAVVNFAVYANDAVSGPIPVVFSPDSGGQFPIGTTAVNCTATDAAGNVAATSFNVKVTTPITAAEMVPPVFQFDAGNAQVTIQSVASHTYQLQRSYTLASGSWSNVGTSQPGGGPLSFPDVPDPSQPKAFYRILITP